MNRWLSFATGILLGAVNCVDANDTLLQSNPHSQATLSTVLTTNFDSTSQVLSRLPTQVQPLAGYSTRCAGYVATAQYEAGLAYCNRALELYEAHWHGLQSRAVARLAFGQTALA